MPIIKHVASKSSSYSNTMDYMEHDHDKNGKEIMDENGKAQERFYLCDTLNVQSKETYASECVGANKYYNQNQKMSDVKQHQYIISFSAEEVKKANLTPEKVMEYGKEWTEKNLPGHQAILYVHQDGHNHSGNLHVHVNINSVRTKETEQKEWMQEQGKHFHEGMKHTCTAPYRHEMRSSLNQIMQKHELDLSIKERSSKHITDREYYADMRGKEREGSSFDTKKEELRECIRETVPLCTVHGQLDEERYKATLQEKYGIEVTESRGRYSYKHPDWDRAKPVSDRKLGDDYRKEHLHELSRQNDRTYGKGESRDSEYQRNLESARRAKQNDKGTHADHQGKGQSDNPIDKISRDLERRESVRERAKAEIELRQAKEREYRSHSNSYDFER